MKRSLQLKINIAVATMVAVFSLAVSFSATYAWLAANNSVKAEGMNIRINNGGSVLSMLTIHRCNLSASTESNLVFYKDPAVTVSASGISTASVTMDNYSDLNKTQPILLLFGLNEGINEKEVVVAAKSDNENYVSTITQENISSFPFSTAVRFKSGGYTNDTFPFNQVDVNSLNQTTSFVNIANHSFDSYSNNINLFEGQDTGRLIKYVAVVMDYYPEAREVLLTNNIGVDLIAANNNNVINFFCDWTLEI